MKTIFNALFALSIVAGVAGTTFATAQAFDAKSFYAESDRARY